MLTIYSTCRSFDIEEFAIIQRNAITSWTLLDPKPEILIMGSEPGVKEFCEELGIIHIPELEYSDYGTPYLDSMMRIAEEKASNNNLLLISSDVVIFQTMAESLKSLVKLEKFCGIARKLQQEKIEPLDFSQDWENQVKENAKWNMITSGDFYLYPKGYWKDVPQFIIGRAFCDSWLFFEAARYGSLVDMTNVVQIVDYKHSYCHLKKEWTQERFQNFILYEGKQADFRDANFRMNENYEILPSNEFNQHLVPE